ncbi:MAG: 50S ribosomal protein L5 [archaeon]
MAENNLNIGSKTPAKTESKKTSKPVVAKVFKAAISKEKRLENKMREIVLEKIVINMGVGQSGEELEKAVKIMKMITNKTPIKTICKVKLPTWGIRPGLPIGCKVTLRGKDALDFINLSLKAKKFRLPKKSFNRDGNFSYGVSEYIEMPGVKYDPSLGIRGFDVCVNLKRRGYRVKLRKYNSRKIGINQIIGQNDAIKFAEEKLKIVVE